MDSAAPKIERVSKFMNCMEKGKSDEYYNACIQHILRKEEIQVTSLELKIKKLEEAKEETDRKIKKWNDQIKEVKDKSNSTIKYYQAIQNLKK